MIEFLIGLTCVVGYGGIAGVIYSRLRQMRGPLSSHWNDDEIPLFGAILWPLLALPFYTVTRAELKEMARIADEKEKEKLLKSEGLA